MARKKAGRYDPKKGSKKLKDLLVEIDDTIKAGGDPVKAAEQLEKGKLSNKKKFTPKDGAYHITESQKSELLKQIRKDVEENNQSRKGVVTKAFIDGEENQLRNRGNVENPSFNFAKKESKVKEAQKRKGAQTHESDLSKTAANKYSRNQKQEFDLGRSFGYESYDEHLIALDQYEKFGSRLHGSHDPQNRLSRFVDDTKAAKDTMETFSTKWKLPWASTIDNEDKLRVVNEIDWDPEDHLDKGVNMSRAEVNAFKRFVDNGDTSGLVPGTAKKFAYLLESKGFPLLEGRERFMKYRTNVKYIGEAGFPEVKNGNGHENGKNGHENGKNGHNGRDKTKTSDVISTKQVNSGISLNWKAVSGIRRGDQIANITSSAVTGNLLAAGVGVGALTITEAIKTPAGQKAISRQVLKVLGKYGRKRAMKMVPGLDVYLSYKEMMGYMAQGKLNQAGIAAISGAIGWVPVIGDGASAVLDLANTGIDIANLDYSPKDDDPKKKKPTTSTNNRRSRRLLKNIK